MNKTTRKIISFNRIINLIISILTLAMYFLYIIKDFNNNKYEYINEKTQARHLSEMTNKNNSIYNYNDGEIYKKYDFENRKFAIVSRNDCDVCGLFSYYSLHLGCILLYLSQGYIPIIKTEMTSVFYSQNMRNIKKNLWEDLFNQPFNYTLDEVKKYAKHIEEKTCTWTNMAPSEGHIYSNELTLKFYRDAARKYMSIKNEIIEEANIIWNKLFRNSKNVLGVLARGTDFVSLKPGGHSIPPQQKE